MKRTAQRALGAATALWRHAWAGPNTALALIVTALLAGAGARVRVRAGAIEVSGRPVGWALRGISPAMPVAALTLGHVIFAPSRQLLLRWGDHERVHVQQYERWGCFFLPAYALASAWAALRGGDAYRDNRFERAAYARDGARPA